MEPVYIDILYQVPVLLPWLLRYWYRYPLISPILGTTPWRTPYPGIPIYTCNTVYSSKVEVDINRYQGVYGGYGGYRGYKVAILPRVTLGEHPSPPCTSPSEASIILPSYRLPYYPGVY